MTSHTSIPSFLGSEARSAGRGAAKGSARGSSARARRPPRRCHPWATAAEENIAFIHRGLDAFSRGDFEVGAALMQPDVEWHVSFRLPDLPMGKTVYRGPDEVMQLWAAFRSVWDELSVTLEEVVEAHGDVAVVRARFVGRGSASGVEVDRTLFYVFEIAAGKLKRLRPFDTEAEALTAAGSEGVGR
jgi:ketosteroid isomerase-like protein